MMWIRSTTPYGANSSRRSCSVTEKAIFPTKIFTGDSFYAVTRGENTVGKVCYCTRNMDPAREETGFDAHPHHLLPSCQVASTGTQEVNMATKPDTPTTPTTATVARTPFGKKLSLNLSPFVGV